MSKFFPSATVTLHGLAMQKRKNGERVYNFAAGDPVLNNHPAIIETAIRETQKQRSPYPPIEGIPELRQLAAEWMNRSCQTQFSKENVLVTSGGKFGLFALLYTLLQQDDEVLIPAPYWVSYPSLVTMANGVAKILPTRPESDWKLTAPDLLQHVSKKIKILILNNACNPTGTIYTKQEISDLLDAAEQAGLTVISDEVYSGLVYGKASFVSCGDFPRHQDRVIIVQSCSKNFGMPGWRVGFVMGTESIIKRLAVLHGQSTNGTALMSQWAAVGALENAVEVNAYVKNAMRKRRDIFMDIYNSLFSEQIVMPESALYAFVPITSMMEGNLNSVAFCEEVLRRGNIAIIPGVAFGVEGYVRFAFSETEEEIFHGLHALKHIVEKVKLEGI